MSGGAFEYLQYRLGEVVERIQDEIEKSGRLKTSDELKEYHWRGSDWYEKYPEDLNHYKYSDEVLAEFKKGMFFIKMAEIYMHRIDRLLSGDDGEETMLERLLKEIEDYEQSTVKKDSSL
jgi:hypothetical protein